MRASMQGRGQQGAHGAVRLDWWRRFGSLKPSRCFVLGCGVHAAR